MRLRLVVAVAACALAGLPVSAWGQTTRQAEPQIRGETNLGTSYLGIGVQEITPERAKALNLKEERGAEVTSVAEDSPAAKAGIKEGDVVLEYNGQAVQGTEQLTRLVRETPPDRQVRIVVWRNGSTQTLTATIAVRGTAGRFYTAPSMPRLPGNMPNALPPGFMSNIPQFDIPRFQMNWQNRMLGIVGEALGPQEQLADFFGVKEGVLVKSVLPNSAAEKAGIHAGDVITKVGDAKVSTTEDIARALRDARDKNTFAVTIVRNKKETSVNVTIESSSTGRARMQPVGFPV